jgi:PAS domain S-box-containing protein
MEMYDPCNHCTLTENRSFCLRQNESLLALFSKKADGSSPSDPLNFLLRQDDFKAIFESSADCILVWDKHYNYLYANQAAIDHLGTTREKVIGKNIREGLGHSPDFMHLCMSRVDEVFRTGQPLRVEDAVHVNDRMVYCQSVLSPICLPCGQMFAVGVLYRDISKQKELENALCRSEKWFQTILQNTNIGVLVADTESRRFTYANPAICRMLGYTREELLHLGVTDVHPKEALNEVMKSFTDIINGANDAFDLPCLRKDGGIVYARINGTLLEAGGKDPVVGFFSDITEQKKLEQDLKQNEKKYRELYDYAQIPLYRNRISDGKVLECNQAMAALFGYDGKEQFLADVYAPKHYVNLDQRTQLLKRLEKEGFVRGFQIEATRRDGSHIWVELSARLDRAEDFIEGAMVDITADKVLTKTEKVILDLVLQGKGSKEIARILERSVRTIEDHRMHIMNKLGVSNLVELVQMCQSFRKESEKKYEKT